MFIKTRLVQGLLLAFGGTAAVWSSGAFAQDASPTATQEPQRVTVTGSNIRRTDTETPSPIQVISADDIKQSGYTSISEVLQSITANGQGTLSQGFSGAFASGASGISLRGLTTAYTLVLIDGHRSAPYPIGDDGQRSFVDVANIPFDSVERIEILKDGASAIYGSDAVAGVVNIILKKNYTGASVGGDIGVATGNTGATRRATASFGIGDLDKDGHNFYIALEGRTQDQIRYIDRGTMFNKTDFTNQGGYDITRGVPNQNTNGGFAGSTTGYVTGPDGTTLAFMPGCNSTSYNAGQCSYKDNWSQVQPNTANFNAVSRLTLNLANDWQASFEGTFFQSKAQQVGAPSTSQSAGYQGITSGPGVVPSLLPAIQNTISSTNPSFPAGAGFTSGPLTYNFLNELGPTVTDTDAKTTRLVADVTGSYFGWDLQGAGGYTQVQLQVLGRGYVNPYNLQSALDSTTDPFLVGQKNSSSMDAFIAPTLVANDVSKLEFFHLGGSHDLMPLKGGELSVAVGYDFVHRVQDALAPSGVADGTTPNFSNNFTVGYQTVNSAFAEVDAPVLKSLDIDGAIRYDHYNLSGGKASPKVGFKWTPVEQFALRGTVAKGFRAPGPAENGTAGQTFFTGNSADPDLCKQDANGNQLVGSFPTQCSVALGTLQSTNAKLKPETSKSFTLGAILEPIKNFSASIDYYNIEIDNQIVAGSSQTAVRGTNFTPIPQVTGFNADGTPITQLETPPEAPIAYYSVSYVNANKTETSGIDTDFLAKFQLPGGFGQFKSDLQFTWMAKYDQTIDGVKYHLAGTHGPLVIGGDTGSPRSRIVWANSVTHGDAEVTATMNYISGYSYTDPSFGGGVDCANAIGFGSAATAFSQFTNNDQVPPGIACKVGSFFTFDLAAHYDVTKHINVHASVLNLFNKGAPLDFATYGGGTAPYNPSLHQQGAIGRFVTVGGNYTF